MKTFDFDLDELFSFNNRTFIPLGGEKPVEKVKDWFQKKLKKETSEDTADVWGTLGWSDNTPFRLKGKIKHSRRGNTNDGDGHKLTEQQIEDLRSINPKLTKNPGEVRERFINFDDVKFDLPDEFDPNDLPQLRLSLFLKPTEGAIVYYEHHEKDNYKDEDAFQEYIMYEKEAQPMRDRLSYCFPVEPKYQLEEVPGKPGKFRQTNTETGLSFTIKILTYKQSAESEGELYREALSELNSAKNDLLNNGVIMNTLVGKAKYELLRFDPKSETGSDVIDAKYDKGMVKYGGRFVRVTKAADVNVNAKTLLLIHGTFVDTMKSYHDVILRKGVNGDQPSYLQYLLASGKFEQILAFDHPTLSHDAGQNIQWLKERMRELGLSFKDNPIDVVTTSRGALVGEYMAADPECAELFPMRKVLMFSAANGSGYFTTGKMISSGLSLWKKSASGPAGKVVLALLQLSVDYILRQPGAVLMTINHKQKVLESILAAKPNNPALIYKCVVSDWHKDLVPKDKWLMRPATIVLDVVIKLNLGLKNDWVIGCQRQELVPVQSQQHRQPSECRYSVHGAYLRMNYVLGPDYTVMSDPHVCIETFFEN